DTAAGAILTINGVISGDGPLTKQGYDTVVLAGANTYTGPTTVESGTLQIGAVNALPVGTSLTTGPAGLFDLNGFDQQVATIQNSSTDGGYITNSSVDIHNLTVGNSNDTAFTYGGTLLGSLALVKTGSDNFTLTGTNTYIGGTIINGGAVTVSQDDNLGQSGTTVSFNGGTLAITTGFGTDRPMTLSGAGTIDVAAGQTLVASGVISGSGSLTMVDTGSLNLMANNTFTGGLVVDAGTVNGAAIAGGGSPLGGPTGNITLAGGTLNLVSGGVSTTTALNSMIVSGNSNLNIAGTAGVNTYLSGQTFSRSAGTTLTVSTSGTGLLGSDDKVLFATAPAPENAVLAGVVVNTGASISLATYDSVGGQGIIPFNSFTETNNINADASYPANSYLARATSVDNTLDSTSGFATTPNGALTRAWASLQDNGQTITQASGENWTLLIGDGTNPGNLVLQAGSIIQSNLGGGTLTLAFGGSEGVISASGTASISSVITGTSGVTVGGTGTVVLSGTNTFTGGVFLSG
ncbi:MAG TPA: autotransporter-associated beta strand repeat-containing protein, partial [Pirellulales bacterium]